MCSTHKLCLPGYVFSTLKSLLASMVSILRTHPWTLCQSLVGVSVCLVSVDANCVLLSQLSQTPCGLAQQDHVRADVSNWKKLYRQVADVTTCAKPTTAAAQISMSTV